MIPVGSGPVYHDDIAVLKWRWIFKSRSIYSVWDFLMAKSLRTVNHDWCIYPPQEPLHNLSSWGWHCGSITKSMTATMAAVLIEKGLLPSWDLTVADALTLVQWVSAATLGWSIEGLGLGWQMTSWRLAAASPMWPWTCCWHIAGGLPRIHRPNCGATPGSCTAAGAALGLNGASNARTTRRGCWRYNPWRLVPGWIDVSWVISFGPRMIIRMGFRGFCSVFQWCLVEVWCLWSMISATTKLEATETWWRMWRHATHASCDRFLFLRLCGWTCSLVCQFS